MKKCDKCGQTIDTWDFPAIYLVKRNEARFGETMDERIDLCLACQRKLRRWLDGNGDSNAVLNSNR